MKLSPTSQIIAQFGSAGLGLGLLIMLVLFYQLPQLSTIRTDIDNRRATIMLLESQQTNLNQLRSQTDQIEAAETVLSSEVWLFSTEDSFYTKIESLAKTAGVTAAEPVVADAVPGQSALLRTATISFSGNLTNIWRAISALQQTKPLIAIKQIDLRRADQIATVQINAMTVWQ